MPRAPDPSLLGALAPTLTAVRLSLHVLAAAVFVGGQITLAGLLPTLRRLGDGATRQVAQAFGRLQWPAYGLLVATGIWNAVAVDPGSESATWRVVFGVKVGLAALVGISALLHSRARGRFGLAFFGALASLGALATLALGVVIAG